jgi:hypothetical protein
MRRILCVFFLLLIPTVLFTSCRGGEPEMFTADQVVTSFSAEMKVQMLDSTIGCTLVRNDEGLAQVCVTDPAPLSGMRFEWRGDGYAISYDGLVCQTQSPFLPSTSFAAAVVNVLASASKAEALTAEGYEEGAAVFSGGCDSGHYKIWVNPSNGFIEKITIQELGLEAQLLEQQG